MVRPQYMACMVTTHEQRQKQRVGEAQSEKLRLSSSPRFVLHYGTGGIINKPYSCVWTGTQQWSDHLACHASLQGKLFIGGVEAQLISKDDLVQYCSRW